MRKPADIVARDDEWATLCRIWERPHPDLTFVLGRRRIGKSYVLSRFARQVNGIYYQATRRTETEQLASLSHVIGHHYEDEALKQGVGFPSWEGLLGYLGSKAGNGENANPLLVVLDEFSYLADAAPALPSLIQRVWDHDWSGTRIKLILSGSYMAAMTRLEAADQPLYGRRTARMVFAPFSYRDVAAFVPSYTPQDWLHTYALVGNLPGHLALLDRGIPFEDNMADLLLHPSSRLLDDAQHLLDAFLGEASVHYSILEAIAGGDATWSRLTSRVGRSGGALLRPLQWLEQMGFVERAVPITEKNPTRSRKVVYRLTDPYLTGWHRFVAPLLRAGSVGLADPSVLFQAKVAPMLDDYMGPIFESVCRDYVRLGGRDMPPGFRPLRVGDWWAPSSDDQVDVVALGVEGDLLVGECKWGHFSTRDVHKLTSRAAHVASLMNINPDRVHVFGFTGLDSMDPGVQEQVGQERLRVITAPQLFEAA
ncbi:MAG: ATP-binding protein [Bacteroidota bacterium]